MPCPYFEPRQVQAERNHVNGRLPLIEEYDGLCHAEAGSVAVHPFAVPEDLRFYCNHGNSRGSCRHFPAAELRSSIRYDVVKQTPDALELLWVEEREYAPFAWSTVRYVLADEQLEPAIADICKSAQIRAFCRSFLDRFQD